jgi:hypothetical protein
VACELEVLGSTHVNLIHIERGMQSIVGLGEQLNHIRHLPYMHEGLHSETREGLGSDWRCGDSYKTNNVLYWDTMKESLNVEGSKFILTTAMFHNLVDRGTYTYKDQFR